MWSLLAQTTSGNYPLSNYWPVLLSVAAPFILALGFGGKWVMNKLDKKDEQLASLYDRILNDFTPAIKAAADAQEKTLDFVKELRGELENERERRFRAERELAREARRQAP